MTTTTSSTRQALIGEAFWLEWLTIAWMTIEGALAIAFGIMAHSIILLAFGIDSGIELISAAVLIWRLGVCLRTPRLAVRLVRRARDLPPSKSKRAVSSARLSLRIWLQISRRWDFRRCKRAMSNGGRRRTVAPARQHGAASLRFLEARIV